MLYVFNCPKLLWATAYNTYSTVTTLIVFIPIRVTRFGDLLDFGQVFEAFGNNKFAQISHILWQFLKRCQNLSFF